MKNILPLYFLKINNFAFIYYFVHGLALWILPAFLGFFVVSNFGVFFGVKIIIAIICSILSGFGFFLLAVLGHEGFHGSLHENRFASIIIGTVASAFVPMFISYGYNVIHWDHHKYTNTMRDPDYALYGKFNNFFTRFIFGPFIVISKSYLISFKTIFLLKIPTQVFPFSKVKIYSVALLNLSLIAINLILCVYLFKLNVLLFLFLFLFPLLVTQFFWSMAPLLEHGVTGKNKFNNTRACTSKVLKFLLLGYNFHIGHHLYPRVQLHKLPKLHEYLVDNDLVEDLNVVDSVVRYYKIGLWGRMD